MKLLSIYDILDIVELNTVHEIYSNFGINKDKIKKILISEIKNNNIEIEKILSTLEYKELKKIANNLGSKEKKTENITNYLKLQNINILEMINDHHLIDILLNFDKNKYNSFSKALLKNNIKFTHYISYIHTIQSLKIDNIKLILKKLNITHKNKKQSIKYIINNLEEIVNFKKEINLTTEIKNIINKIKIKKSSANTERKVEEITYDILSFLFDNIATQYKTGGYWGTKIDIDINNGSFGIELKLAKSLLSGTSEIFRLIGQAIYYKKKLYLNNFIVAIAGTKEEINNPIIIELFDILNDLNINFTIINII